MASAADRPSADPYVGAVIDEEFRVEEKLGTGGMGSVYRAVQRLTERSVALKVLHPHLCDPTMERRFRQEAQIISRLNHPNIVTVFKCGVHGADTLYIAMEYVQGRGLDAVLEEGRALDVDRALPLMVQIAGAVAYAHEQKIVHRDLKPENMVLTRTGRTEAVKILDFGIAKMLDGNAVLTRTGVICGSPAYMAPEQWQQLRDLDGRTDIYALGCVFYEMVTGRQPFQGDSVVALMAAHVQGPRPRPPLDVAPGLASLPALSEVIMRCLARDRADRYADAYALVEALEDTRRQYEASQRAREAPGRPATGPHAQAPARPATEPHAQVPPRPATRPRPQAAARPDAGLPTAATQAFAPTARPTSGPHATAPPARPATEPHPPARVASGTQAYAPTHRAVAETQGLEAPARVAAGTQAYARDAAGAVRPLQAPPAAGRPAADAAPEAGRVAVATVVATPATDAAAAAPEEPGSLPPLDVVEINRAPTEARATDRLATPAADPPPGDAPGAGEAQGFTERLRAITAEFADKDEQAPDGLDEAAAAAQAARTHVLLVAAGGVLCTALALALVLLR